MYRNKSPITTAGMSQQTTGIKIQGKNEAAYEPVITEFPNYILQDELYRLYCEAGTAKSLVGILNIFEGESKIYR
jgi:hypothetical protein